jgi:hypothetical protein
LWLMLAQSKIPVPTDLIITRENSKGLFQIIIRSS